MLHAFLTDHDAELIDRCRVKFALRRAAAVTEAEQDVMDRPPQAEVENAVSRCWLAVCAALAGAFFLLLFGA